MSLDDSLPTTLTLTGDKLDDIGGKDLWHERFWETLRRNEFHFQFAIGNGNTSATKRRLHLPGAWPDPEAFDRDPFEKTGDEPFCPRQKGVDQWTFKPVSCYPVGYLEVCSVCMREFVDWWHRCENHHEDDIRPQELVYHDG